LVKAAEPRGSHKQHKLFYPLPRENQCDKLSWVLFFQEDSMITKRIQEATKNHLRVLANQLVAELILRGFVTEYPPARDIRERNGRIHVIAGEMFSGKSEELIRLLRRNIFAKIGFVVFKPARDNRTENVWCRNGHELEAIKVHSSREILEYIVAHPEVRVIGIDEAQFFEMDDLVVEVVRTLADKYHIVVFVAGLDMTFEGVPFNNMPFLMAIATEVHKVHAVCVECGRTATYSRRNPELGSEQIAVDNLKQERYQAVCRRHRPF